MAMIKRAIAEFPWEDKFNRIPNPNHQVDVLNKCILNIMSNFVPNETKKVLPQEPRWLSRHVQKLLRNQHNGLALHRVMLTSWGRYSEQAATVVKRISLAQLWKEPAFEESSKALRQGPPGV